MAGYDARFLALLELFPDISPEYLENVAEGVNQDAEAIIQFILDESEQGRPYERIAQGRTLKRKREAEDDEGPGKAEGAFDNQDGRQRQKSEAYSSFS